MTDWVVWPIFLIQFVAFSLLLFKNRSLFGVRAKTWSLSILVLVNIAIVLSLWHDSSDVLNLYF